MNEGSTHKYTYTISDPGTDTVTAVTTSCGTNGTKSNDTHTNTGGSFDCTFPDGPAGSRVTVQATDSDGAAGNTATQTVTVNNVDPTATFGNDGPVNEGTSFHLSLTNPHDASAPDEAAGFTYAFDCGSGSSYGAFGASNTATCPTTDSGVRNVKGKLKDKDGGVREYTGTVTVNNIGPTVTLSGPTTANEGDTKSYSYTWTDPGSSDTFTRSVSCGTNGVVSADTFSSGAKTGSFNCTWSDDSGAGNVTVTAAVADDDGGVGSDSKSVKVSNVAPTVGITSPLFGTLYAKNGTSNPTVNMNASFTDPGKADTHTCTVTWDDGTPNTTGTVVETPGSGSGTCSASHTYTTPGVYTIGVTVKDDDGGSGYAETMVVVYDASAGFITGGGTIDVQAGSVLSAGSAVCAIGLFLTHKAYGPLARSTSPLPSKILSDAEDESGRVRAIQ